MSNEAKFEISVCFFPRLEEVELTYRNIDSGKQCLLTLKCSKDQGEKLVEVIGPCVYYRAKLVSN